MLKWPTLFLPPAVSSADGILFASDLYGDLSRIIEQTNDVKTDIDSSNNNDCINTVLNHGHNEAQLQAELTLTSGSLNLFARSRHESEPQKVFPEDHFILRDPDERFVPAPAIGNGYQSVSRSGSDPNLWFSPSYRFRCTFCEHKTSSRSRCREHVRTHTGVKPYQCELCGRCFNKRECRDNHVRSRHTLEKPYNCNLCPKSYSSSAALAVHRKACRMKHGLIPDNT